MRFRNASINDLEQIADLEVKCFPPAEAATEKEFIERVKYYGNHFWLLYEDGKLIRRAIDDAKLQGRRGLVLTCKERLIPYYAKFGFKDEGVSDKSTHGNVVWHQMRLTF